MLLIMGTQIHNIDYRIKGAIEHKQDAIEVHFIMAVLVFVLLLARATWSKKFLAKAYKPIFKSVYHQRFVYFIHALMYLVLLSLMISGLLMINNYEHSLHILNILSFSQNTTEQAMFNFANNIHLYLEDAIYALIAIHFFGVVYSKK